MTPRVPPAERASFFDGIASALNQRDIQAALRDVLALIIAELGLASGWIWLLEPTSDRFYLAAAHRLPPYLAEPVAMTGEPCWCMESFRDGDFVSQSLDVISCSRLRRGLREGRVAETGGLLTHASIALRFGRTSLGLLNVCPTPGSELSAAAMTTLSAAGAQIGLAIERARLAERELEAARVDERVRLARDLHDTVTQDLVAIALQLEAALRVLPPAAPARAPLESALGVARRSIDGARASVLSLRAGAGSTRGLSSALAALAHDFTSETGVPVHVRTAADIALAAEVEEELFRIAAEALMNVRKHAGARDVHLELAREGETAVLTVRDDGAGFAAERAAANRFGLEGMRERAAAIEGRLELRSQPGVGTVVRVLVPYRPA